MYRSKLIPWQESARVRRVPEVTAADPVEAWRALNAAHASVHAALESELRKAHDLSTIEFEVLERLSCCTRGKVRMSELAEVVHATQSTVSRVVARLEEEGLAHRAMCTDDRRGIFASVTDAGRERVTAATPTYRRVIAAKLDASA
jgi:DNA-binding MarR family transcriptional regulator